MGNVVIIDRGSNVGGGRFILYAHLNDITVPDHSFVSTGNPIGHVGTTGFNQLSRQTCRGVATGAHVHFEVKDAPVLENPHGDASCNGTYWGYTPCPPDELGYHDALAYLHPLVTSTGRLVSIIDPGGGVRIRVGPGGVSGADPTATPYREIIVCQNAPGIGQCQAGAAMTYQAMGRRAPATLIPACNTGWEQIRPTDPAAFPGLRFPDRDKSPGSIPDGWVCADFLRDPP